MSKLAEIRARSTFLDILEGMPQHLGIAFLMTVGAFTMLRDHPHAQPFLGLTSAQWARWSIGLALVHQIMVGFVFRLQLHRNLMSRLFGGADMKVWAVLFMPLLIARPITVFLTGWPDLTGLTNMRMAEVALGAVLLVPMVWGMHSVLKYFTLPRALGGDHFRDHYAEMPLVREGVFKYTDNAMYGLVFLGLWGIAILCGSWNALVVALFQHSYIWVHMYCTEKPDMEWIYGGRGK